MSGPFVHDIDPVIGRVGGLWLWWYGASYSLGFVGAFLWIRRARRSLGLSLRAVWTLAIALASGVLLGGRVVEVLFYEGSYYGDHLRHVPAVWLGGMSTHGILLGAVVATWVFCKRSGVSFLAAADTLAVAGAWIMGVGRIGNFVDGQISGSVTDAWWGVKFPDLEGYRHPVVLYDGLKNLLLVPVLLWIRGRKPARGVVFGHFVLWYGLLRVLVDFFREYRSELLGLPPGQHFNALMALGGVALVLWARRRGASRPVEAQPPRPPGRSPAWRQRALFAALVLVPLVIPSDWTQDVPWRYGDRHAGLAHTALYPAIPEARDDRAPSDPPPSGRNP